MPNRLFMRGLLLSASLGAGLLGGRSALGSADVPLDPNAFASLGALSGATTYVFNTGNGSSTPTVTLNGSTVLNGVISNGVAVFDFSSVTISTGTTATGSGALPLAILSRGAVSISGVVNMSATGPTGGPGGFSAPSVGRGNGPGGGSSSGGAGFGGVGGAGFFGGGGPTYGDLTHAFLGGSSGGGSGTPGGGGGGALEISALGNISFQTGTLSSNGGNDTSNSPAGSGGGSGGGILLATPGQILGGTVNVVGGIGGGAFGTAGGDGGGGRILLESSLFSTTDPALINVAGGSGPNASGPTNPGSPGTFTTIGYVTPVPEPGMLALALSAGAALLARRRR